MHLEPSSSNPADGSLSHPESTKPRVERQFTCRWSIANFAYLYASKNASVLSFLQSDTFSPFTDEAQCRFFLRIHPNDIANSGTHLSLHLHAEFNGHLKEMDVSCRLALIDLDEEECNQQGTFTDKFKLTQSMRNGFENICARGLKGQTQFTLVPPLHFGCL